MKRLPPSRRLSLQAPNSSKWNEIRTALYVGRLGTVAAAAKTLNVHRATVVRHIDTIEASLGEKLFQRHPKGYTLTDLGAELIELAADTENDFKALAGRAASRDVEVDGALHITSRDVANALVIPLLDAFLVRYPRVNLRYTPTWNKFRLDYGEAHISLLSRDLVLSDPAAGRNPRVHKKHFMDIEFGLYAGRQYVERYGVPDTIADAPKHHFAVFSIDEPFHTVHTWLQERIPPSSIAFECGSPLALDDAIKRGMAIGFLPNHVAKSDRDLVPVLEPWPDVTIPLWFVAHEDMYANAKIAAFFAFLDEYMATLRRPR